ncbi:MAG TPA: response regulator [Ramlibacter sp.]|uniref:hybrid sensor histidine kinase/response regulator n=1 Tax=Ramlibacter sp. TaxID=1917967 RepID=UPI002CE201D0|nr:response regulator [Ramlibacter sp.]HVZ43471.1 response regulator [Ramlibacter sp.]
MAIDRKELQARLLAAFRQEAAEHVQSMSSGLMELEQGASAERRAALVEQLFREAHSLKGAARAVDLARIEALCQAAEEILAACKRGERELTPEMIDALHESVDAALRLIPDASGAAPSGSDAATQGALAKLRALAAQAPAAAAAAATAAIPREAPPPPPPAVAAQTAAPAVAESSIAGATVRIATGKLDALLFRAEEMRTARLLAAQHAADLSALLPDAGPLRSQLAPLAQNAQRHLRSLAAAADGLLDDVKSMLVLPASFALEVLPKTVRDLSRDRGKQVHLAMTGTDIEIDRRILQELRDPLLHLVRNSIDHGFEPPEERARAGKPATGTLSIAVEQRSGNRIEIVISDDGQGIDASRVREAAGRAGLDAKGASGGQDPLDLVFHSGVSTAREVSDLSGRGLGLAIVREKVERLGGVVTVESEPGRGTTFRLALPVSLATFRAVHVQVAGSKFFLPTTHVEQALRISPGDVRHVENRETIAWRGETLPLVHLSQALELTRRAAEEDTPGMQAIVVAAGSQHIAFAVDAVLGEQEVMAKPLGPLLARVRNVSGATVLGDGEAVAILHVPDLMRSAAHAASRPLVADAAPAATAKRRKSVLVAEDSITSRTLLQNILEMAGYRVSTAVDGIDAFTQLKTGRYDVVVSDVEMPRMNGFDLTARIRADPGLAETPVVLVTALASQNDRERGVDAGADAYIVKSNFDQGDLLAALERLA